MESNSSICNAKPICSISVIRRGKRDNLQKRNNSIRLHFLYLKMSNILCCISISSVKDIRKAICQSMIWIPSQMIDLSELGLDRLCIAKIGMGSSIFYRKDSLRPTIPFHSLVFGMLTLDLTNHKLDASLEISLNTLCMFENIFKLI